MIDNLKQMGALRNLLHLAAVAMILVLPFAEPAWHPKGWDIILGAVIPAVVPVLFVVIMLDVLMCSVWKADTTEPDRKQHFSRIVRVHLLLGILMMLLWVNSFSDALFR